MDKDLLRIVIIVTGAMIFFGILLWSMLQSRKTRRRNINFYDKNKNPLDKIDRSLIVNLAEDDFDIVPLGSAVDKERDKITIKKAFKEDSSDDDSGFESDNLFADFDDDNEFDEIVETEVKPQQQTIQPTSAAKENMPDLIQFSLVAANEQGFNGEELVSMLSNAGLVYGDLKIFERLDEMNRVDFGVASMVNPGTFPEQDLDLFSCPGVVFFMQPKVLDDPLTVFNDLVSLLYLLSRQLHGKLRDSQRQPLTEETIETLRQVLSN